MNRAALATDFRPEVRPPVGFTYIYFFGTEDGGEVKLGRTQSPTERLRQHENNNGRHEPLRWLAVLIGTPADEKALKRHFKPWVSRGRSGEWIHAGDIMRDYLRYLRDQSYVATSVSDLDGLAHVDSREWLPGADRSKVLVQLDLDHLDGSDPWADLTTSVVMDGDFYTDRRIIACAHQAMGGVDLDPASCRTANSVVQATRFFGAKENGLLNDWSGRVWLNPPFGGWGDWVEKLMREWTLGHVEQMCVLAPTRAITARNFHPLVRAAAMVWIGNGRFPFWGPKASSSPDEGHVVFYFGGRWAEFGGAFSSIGTVYKNAAS